MVVFNHPISLLMPHVSHDVHFSKPVSPSLADCFLLTDWFGCQFDLLDPWQRMMSCFGRLWGSSPFSYPLFGVLYMWIRPTFLEVGSLITPTQSGIFGGVEREFEEHILWISTWILGWRDTLTRMSHSPQVAWFHSVGCVLEVAVFLWRSFEDYILGHPQP